MPRRAFGVSLVLAILAILSGPGLPGHPRAVWAADCGGSRECRCGDRVVRNYRLPADLGPCAKHGLSLAAGVTLDGGGRTIRGTRQRSSSGVILDEKATGARVTNLVVTGFERGVRLAGVDGARVDRVEAHNNGDPVAHKGYGIDVARGPEDTAFYIQVGGAW